MKKHGAYAFRSFDPQRILQRAYFRELNLATTDDNEILKSLQATSADDVNIMEQKLQMLKLIHNRLKKFLQLINRHIGRLARYSAKTGENVIFDYVASIFFLRDLGKRFAHDFVTLEKKIQTRYKKDFSERLKQERKARGLTQKELGDLINVSPQAFSLYERGERDFPVHVIIRLAKILNISGDKILGLSAN